MKKIIIAMAAIAAAFTMVSCNKEQLTESEGTLVVGNDIITAFTENNLTKTSLEGDDENGYDVVWSEGDAFKLAGNTFTLIKGAGTTIGTFEGTVPSILGWYTAYYPASYDGTNWPLKQTYTGSNGITGSPMEAGTAGGIYCRELEFKNVGGILRLTVKGTARVTSIKVDANSMSTITLDCGDGVDLDNANGTVFHIAMPEGTYSETSIMFITTEGKYCAKKLKTDLVINRSEITPATIKLDDFQSLAPNGAITETFTVSAEGKKVFFSKGNLYWSGSVYGFENNQYDINVAGHQSSFFWSNKAEYARGTEWNLDINAPMAFFTNADEVTANPGFTANGQTGLWRTLSKDEWSYLINRKNGIGEATISGVKGVIIFSDEYDGQTDGLTSIPEGCVFLPAGRDGGVISLYWSSTSTLNPSSYIPTAAALRYEDGAWPPYVVHDGMPEKKTVRLVTDLSDNPTPTTLTVTFDLNGKAGTAPAQYTGTKYRTTITKPEDPKVGNAYSLRGWYKDRDCTAEWNFDTDVVVSNLTLYAKWGLNGILDDGVFTVDSSGKKVYFSWGNLWYGKTSEEAASATFNFETNQYDYRIIWDSSLRWYLRDDNHVSHFLWSSNAGVACAPKYNDPSGSGTDAFFTNADETNPNPNFTVNGQTGVWRALSKDEWKYLIDNNGSDWATIKGINGLIIFCDGYSGSRTSLTEIPKGCLFLPAAGYSDGISEDRSIYEAGELGYYWSASTNDFIDAFELYFDSVGVNPSQYGNRSNARSVRLVMDVK